MTVGSNVNPNYPIPGVDQSSRGFRDNFATIKTEIENLQSKNIQIAGSLVSEPVQIGNGTGDIVIPVDVSLANIQAAGSNHAVQYNLNNVISGSQIYFVNGLVGIGTNLPHQALDVIGNLVVMSTGQQTMLQLGQNLIVNASTASTTFGINTANVIVINNADITVGIGSAPQATLDVWSHTNDVMIVRSLLNNQDNSLRYTTSQTNSTLGLTFEQRNTNRVGGLRMDQNGNVTLHAGENSLSNLSNATRIITLLANRHVGINSTDPQVSLDVGGDAAVSGNLAVKGSLAVGTVPTITGSITSGAALGNLLVAMASMGLIINNTTI
jgi:hypothetical protein